MSVVLLLAGIHGYHTALVIVSKQSESILTTQILRDRRRRLETAHKCWLPKQANWTLNDDVVTFKVPLHIRQWPDRSWVMVQYTLSAAKIAQMNSRVPRPPLLHTFMQGGLLGTCAGTAWRCSLAAESTDPQPHSLPPNSHPQSPPNLKIPTPIPTPTYPSSQP